MILMTNFSGCNHYQIVKPELNGIADIRLKSSITKCVDKLNFYASRANSALGLHNGFLIAGGSTAVAGSGTATILEAIDAGQTAATISTAIVGAIGGVVTFLSKLDVANHEPWVDKFKLAKAHYDAGMQIVNAKPSVTAKNDREWYRYAQRRFSDCDSGNPPKVPPLPGGISE